MENESVIIKKALAIVKENNSELRKAISNKTTKIAASPEYYIVGILADQIDENDPTMYETKRFVSAASDLDDNAWKILFELYGWSNVRTSILRRKPVLADLYPEVPNDAITEGTMTKARGTQAVSYYVEVPFLDEAGNDDEKIFVTQPSYMIEANFRKFLTKALGDAQVELIKTRSKIRILPPKFRVAKGPGSFKFEQVSQLFTGGLSVGGLAGSGLAQEFAWVIECRGSAGTEYVFTTVKSDTPVELYEQKLKAAGFVNIKSRVTSKPGQTTLNDLELSTLQSNMSNYLKRSDTFENLTRGVNEIRDKYESSNVGKVIKTIKQLHDWWKK